jgi:hypothetical protein
LSFSSLSSFNSRKIKGCVTAAIDNFNSLFTLNKYLIIDLFKFRSCSAFKEQEAIEKKMKSSGKPIRIYKPENKEYLDENPFFNY